MVQLEKLCKMAWGGGTAKTQNRAIALIALHGPLLPTRAQRLQEGLCSRLQLRLTTPTAAGSWHTEGDEKEMSYTFALCTHGDFLPAMTAMLSQFAKLAGFRKRRASEG